jgi:hypothetical protein
MTRNRLQLATEQLGYEPANSEPTLESAILNTTMATPFEELTRLAEESGVEKALDFLEHHFRRDKEYFKLFEILKMRCRHRLGLPLVYTEQPDDLNDDRQKDLEDGLIAACREVGTLLFKNGQIQEGWMYLQPVGDKSLSDKLIRAVKIDEENIDTVVEIAVSQGAAPEYGYGLLLEHYGTCNGITTFDTQSTRFDNATQSAMAKKLLTHLYDELSSNVRYAIKQNGNEAPEDATLGELMKQFPGLTENGAHHIDTTHLASAMRICRSVSDSQDLQKAKELAEYGSGLSKDFRYPGVPPFEETYVDHLFYYRALAGEKTDEAIEHFRGKIQTVSVEEFGPVAAETLSALLMRLGRHDEAIEVATEHFLGKHEPMGISPNPFEMASDSAQAQKLMKFYQSQDDLLGFAISLLGQSSNTSSAES